MGCFKLRDKIEMVVATAILISWFVGFELTGTTGEPTWPTRLLVIAAAITMFGDNVFKAREFFLGQRDNHGDSDAQ